MRKAFIGKLVEIAKADPRVVLLTGDLGYTVIEPFADQFPDRFFNAGVAEQNMVGMATGLAEAGFIPFVYSIATFASLRPYEFIRNGPILQQLPVRIVGVGGGFDYGPAGPTHYALEDLGIMRIQPGIAVICPADHEQAASALQATWDLPGPVYYRIGKDDSSTIAGLNGRFNLGTAEKLRQGKDLLMVTIGSIASEAMAAAEELESDGIGCAVVVASSLNPAPQLVAALREFPLALSVEAHYVNGGLGSLVSELIAEEGLSCRLVRCGVRTASDGMSGRETYMNHLHGLSASALGKTARAALQEM
ncbi:MAG: transketolase family protein [Actinomycetota bacterium]